MDSSLSLRLDGKVALVTGGSRGIGAAIVRRLGAEGARVAIHYSIHHQAAEGVANELRAQGREVALIQGDLSNPEVVSEILEGTIRLFGRLDILVNNAGVGERRAIEETSLEHFERLISVNLRAPLFASVQAARHLSGGGRIINISSRAAHSNLPGNAVYSASKAALEAVTRVHAAELGPRGITVNAVAPGPTETEMFRDFVPPEYRQWAIQNTPLRRIAEPDDIADIVAFLASHEARWITGQVIGASGGLSMK